MVHMPVFCPYCHSDAIVKRGKTNTGKQRYRCQNEQCSHQSFLRDPAYTGYCQDNNMLTDKGGHDGTPFYDCA